MNTFLLAITCRKLTIETQMQGVKYAHRQQERHRNIFDVTFFYIQMFAQRT